MTYYPVILVDSGILVAYYSAKDRYHQQVRVFFERCTSNLVTTVGCATEVMWLLSSHWRIKNLILQAVAKGIFETIPLLHEYFSRIAELNQQYADLPGDFADLSLVAISERLNIPIVATLDSGFDVIKVIGSHLLREHLNLFKRPNPPAPFPLREGGAGRGSFKAPPLLGEGFGERSDWFLGKIEMLPFYSFTRAFIPEK